MTQNNEIFDFSHPVAALYTTLTSHRSEALT